MTSRRDVFDGRSADELDGLIRWALCDSVGHAQPPAHVWRRIRHKVQRRMTGGSRRHTRSAGPYQPARTFNVWAAYAPPSLVCLIEPQMGMLQVG